MPLSRSILKSGSPAPCSSNPSPTHHRVQFCPNTRTFLTHSTSEYDRTPVDVPKNPCELPARGCPGLTYPVVSDTRDHHHPRRFAMARESASDATHSPTSISLPALIPDISESDDSDGLVSPPPESADRRQQRTYPSQGGFSISQIPDSSLAFLPHARASRPAKDTEARRSSLREGSCVIGKLRTFPSLSLSDDGAGCLEGF